MGTRLRQDKILRAPGQEPAFSLCVWILINDDVDNADDDDDATTPTMMVVLLQAFAILWRRTAHQRRRRPRQHQLNHHQAKTIQKPACNLTCEPP